MAPPGGWPIIEWLFLVHTPMPGFPTYMSRDIARYALPSPSDCAIRFTYRCHPLRPVTLLKWLFRVGQIQTEHLDNINAIGVACGRNNVALLCELERCGLRPCKSELINVRCYYTFRVACDLFGVCAANVIAALEHIDDIDEEHYGNRCVRFTLMCVKRFGLAVIRRGLNLNRN